MKNTKSPLIKVLVGILAFAAAILIAYLLALALIGALA
jgi:hypothetical protein